jgi:hypothetical protein
MNDREAMQALLDGKKIRRSVWGRGEHIELTSDGTLLDEVGHKIILDFKVSFEDYDNWQIYTEPKSEEYMRGWNDAKKKAIDIVVNSAETRWAANKLYDMELFR